MLRRFRGRECGGWDRPRAQNAELVVVGGSAGAIGALRELLSRLPADFPAAIVVVQHAVDYVVPVEAIPDLLCRLTGIARTKEQDYSRNPHTS